MTNPRLDPLPQINWFGQHDFDFVDLCVEPPAADLPDLDPLVMRAALGQYGLGVVVHTSPYLPITNPHPAARKLALRELLQTLHLARKIHAPLMTTHYVGAPEFFSTSGTRAYYIDLLAELCDAAAGTGVAIALENSRVNRGEVALFREIFLHVPAVRLLLDVGHANIGSSSNLSADFLWDPVVGARLSHVHIADNDGWRDLHLPLGSIRNAIDWPEIVGLLRKHGYDGTVTLEIFSPDVDYLLASRDKFVAWWHELGRSSSDIGAPSSELL